MKTPTKPRKFYRRGFPNGRRLDRLRSKGVAPWPVGGVPRSRSSLKAGRWSSSTTGPRISATSLSRSSSAATPRNRSTDTGTSSSKAANRWPVAGSQTAAVAAGRYAAQFRRVDPSPRSNRSLDEDDQDGPTGVGSRNERTESLGLAQHP